MSFPPVVTVTDAVERLVGSKPEVRWNTLVSESVRSASVEHEEVTWLARLFDISETGDEVSVPVVMRSLVIGVRSE